MTTGSQEATRWADYCKYDLVWSLPQTYPSIEGLGISGEGIGTVLAPTPGDLFVP